MEILNPLRRGPFEVPAPTGGKVRKLIISCQLTLIDGQKMRNLILLGEHRKSNDSKSLKYQNLDLLLVLESNF